MIKTELKELLQKHDSEIFTDELVESVTDVLQTTIDTEVNERVRVIQDEKEQEVSDLKESIEEKSIQFEDVNEEKMEKIVSTLSKMMDETIEELFESNKVDYENVAIVNEAIEIHKTNKQLAEKYHISVDGLEEDMSSKKKLSEAKEMYNELYQAHEELNDKIDTYSQIQIVNKVTEGMTSIQKDDLLSLTSSLNESDITSFEEKVENIKKVILKESNERPVRRLNETEVDDINTLNEDVDEETDVSKKVKTYNMFGPK